MTAETDAMRLVPTKATHKQLEDAAFNLSAEIGPEEALKLAPHIERAYELLVASAPAVQPAAGREPYGWIYETFAPGVEWCASSEWWPAKFTRTPPNPKTTRNVIALYAHPPAQGSESGGEDREAVRWIRKASREITGGNCAFVDDDLAILAHLAKRAVDAGLTDGLSPQVQAALSQPGPASEGDGE